MTILPTALGLARQLVKTDRHLASALALAHERDLAWAEQRRQMQEGRATFSQPVTSPVQVSLLPNVSAPGEEQCEQHDLSDASSRSNAVETIPNPPIPGDPAPSVDALFARVNRFAKTRGFGVIKAHGMIRPGQRSRYVLQCDRYGAPRPGRGAGLRKRKSRKSGAYGRLLPRPCQRTVFSGLCGTSQMRNTTTIIITPVPMPPLTQFIDDLLDL
ncbi:hypothetical protein BFJ67_g13245 [Fusarium oxysporum f. sp. cepae]|nr:hypothetical protein BFJ67_g13245 [Fusarium oxysporum f. sp. cepae]